MMHEFTLHMHDQVEAFEIEEIYPELPWDKFTDIAKETFSPGYGVSIVCEVDTETGETWATGLKKPDHSVVPLAEKVLV